MGKHVLPYNFVPCIGRDIDHIARSGWMADRVAQTPQKACAPQPTILQLHNTYCSCSVLWLALALARGDYIFVMAMVIMVMVPQAWSKHIPSRKAQHWAGHVIKAGVQMQLGTGRLRWWECGDGTPCSAGSTLAHYMPCIV
jgi:hypothetical protein